MILTKSDDIFTGEEVLVMLVVAKEVVGRAASKYPKEEVWKVVKSRVTIKKERIVNAITTVTKGDRKRKFSPMRRPLSGSPET